MKGQIYSVVSGVIAAMASLCGKFAMSDHEAKDICEISMKIAEIPLDEVKIYCSKHIIALRFFSFILMLLLNCIMWTSFTKALRFTSTSLEATIINTASNFFSTAAIGQVVFNETVRGLWWMGTAFILCGLLLMHHSKTYSEKKVIPPTLDKRRKIKSR